MTRWLCVVFVLFVSSRMSRADDASPAPAQNNRIQFAPVFVNPTMQWAVPNSNLNGPPPANLAAGMISAPYFGEYSGGVAVMVGVGAHGRIYDFDWVSYYRNSIGAYWAVPNSNLNGPPANLSSGIMMPH